MDGPNCTYINVHTDENDNAEVRVQSVADEQGREDDPPSRETVFKQVVAGWTVKNALYLKNQIVIVVVVGKHGRIPVKVRSQHINVDINGYSHFRKSKNTYFYQYLQMFGDVSQKFINLFSKKVLLNSNKAY